MTAGPIPTSPLTDFYNNTTPFTPASSSAIDAAIIAIVTTVNDNWAAFYSSIQTSILPNPDGSVTTAKLRDASVITAKLADLAVTSAKIAVGAVGASQLDPALLTIYADIAINAKFALIDASLLLKADQSSLSIVSNARNSKSSNVILNSNFNLWQRGTSFSTNGYTADRWFHSVGASGATQTTSRQSFTVGQVDVPNEPQYFCRISRSVAGSSASDFFEQRIEDVRTFSGSTVTVSFWAKAAVAKTFKCRFTQNFGSGGSTSVSTANASFTLSTVWQKFDLTFTLSSISGKTIGTSSYLDFSLLEDASFSTFTLDIAQVQINLGSSSIPYQPMSLDEELLSCQRYYEKSYNYDVNPMSVSSVGAMSTIASNTAIIPGFRFKANKRISASTVNVYSPSGTAGKVWNSADVDVSSGAIASNIGDSGCRYINCTGAGLTAGTLVTYHFVCDAEL